MKIEELNERLGYFLETSDALVDKVTSRRLDRLVAAKNKNMNDIRKGADTDKSAKEYDQAESKLANHYKLKNNRKVNYERKKIE